MKIAIVSDAVYPYNIGGKEKRIYEISTRLAKAGHSVTIYTMKWWTGKKLERVEHGVRLKAISPLYPLYSGERRSMREAIFFALHCFKLLRENFDVIDVDHMPHLVLFPLKIVTLVKRKKLFVTWNEVWGRVYWKKYVGKVLGEVAYIIERMSVKMADEIISVSDHTTKKLQTELGVKQPIHTIPNGINLSEISKVRPSKQHSDVMYAGRLLEHKNVDVLIKAIRDIKPQFPNISCLIVGNGPEEGKLKQMVKKFGLEKNIIFYDFMPKHEDVYALMKSSKVFVLPSDREGFGLAAIEANASGIPVITTDHKDNATKDLIKDGQNGYVVKGAKSGLSQVLTESFQRSVDSKVIFKAVQEYDWDVIGERVKGVYLQ